MLYTVSTQHQYSDIMYAVGYTVATCFDRKRSSSGQYRTFCLRYRKVVLIAIQFRLHLEYKIMYIKFIHYIILYSTVKEMGSH